MHVGPLECSCAAAAVRTHAHTLEVCEDCEEVCMFIDMYDSQEQTHNSCVSKDVSRIGKILWISFCPDSTCCNVWR